MRVILARFTDGFSTDMNCWAAWGNRMEQLGAAAFYDPDYFCDYPPLYLYVLGFLSKISTVFQLPESGYLFLLKLPAILADGCLAVLIFQYCKKQMPPTAACLLSGLFLISPVFLYNSAVWGQIESVLLLFMVLSILSLSKKRYLAATLFYVLAVLTKPQALLIAPLFLLALLESRSLKTILLSILSGTALLFFLMIPFSPAWQEYTGFPLLVQLFNPLWLLEKYLATLASYPYFSVNAFNFYALLNLNWVPFQGVFLSLLNNLILVIGVAGSCVLYLKIQDKDSRIWISGYVLLAFLYTFAFKMHERYLILPILFLLFGFFSSKNRKLLYLFIGLNAVSFCNLFYILMLDNMGQNLPDYRIVAPLALFEVLLFMGSLIVIIQDFLLRPKTPEENETAFAARPTVAERLEAHKWMQMLRGNPCAKKEYQMVRLDYLLLGVILLIYTAVAYTNLGDTVAPQTYYQAKESGETILIHLENEETIHEIDYYCGVGDVAHEPGLILSYSADGENWTSYASPVCPLRTVFYWDVQPLEKEITAKYLRLTATSTDYMLFEVGFRNIDGELVSIHSTEGENASFLADEQHLVNNQPSFENSTYFDEIYHPRTAFEHLHFLPYYETTHPPLGKLMMAVGIALFGMTPFGWRFAGTLMGVLMLPIFYLFLKRLFGRTRYAVMGTLLFAFDFMHFSLTRLATIDSYPVFFILGMYYFMYRFAMDAFSQAETGTLSLKPLWRHLALSGLCMGLGCASKWTAVYAAAGLGVEFLIIMGILYGKMRQTGFWKFALSVCSCCLLFFVLIPAGIYLLSYLPIAMVDGYGNVFEVMWENQGYMFRYHSGLVDTHPYSSPWYSWPFVYKPMWAYQAPETSIPAGTIGCISIFQNPLLSWVGILALGYSLLVGWKKRDFKVLFLFFGFLAQYLPWALVSRYALQYHFFAGMVFLILFVVYAMQDLEQRVRRFGYASSALTICCLLLFLFFYPVLSGVPVSRFFAETILTWFDSWVFFI
ncbi:MAG: glycosyltransferase family 39 protein [Clostridia bacterium]|nr:glycosyltransferase family 39 protein [Clostridia bacterium]